MSDEKPRVEILGDAEVEQIRVDYRRLLEQAVAARRLITGGRFTEAGQVLAGVEPIALRFITEASFGVFQMLGQCARIGLRFDDARMRYAQAFEIASRYTESDARTAGNMQSIAAAGIASVALAEENLPEASEWYGMAVELARAFSDGDGLAAELQSYAEVLHRMRDDRAEDVYREALGLPGVSTVVRGVILDNFSRELERRGRVAEAVQHCEYAVTMLGEAGADYERFKALINLATLARQLDPARSTDAFVAAHELIHRIHARVDAAHYVDGYVRRVVAINEEMRRRISDPDTPSLQHPAFDAMVNNLVARFKASDPGTPLSVDGFRYAVANQIAKSGLKNAIQLFLEHRYTDAEAELRLVELTWQHLGAHHELPKVWAVLGQIHTATGHPSRAWAVLERARVEAHRLGDAQGEFGALIGLLAASTHLEVGSGPNPLELLAQARALHSFMARSVSPDSDGGENDGGALDRMEFELCDLFDAVDLAERSLRRSIEIVARYPDKVGDDTRVTRLCRLLRFLAEHARFDEARSVRDELEAISESLTQPNLRYSIHTAIALVDFRAGEWTKQTLHRFRDGCAAFEQVHPGPLGLGETDQLAGTAASHYLAAAELALHLGYRTEAFELLERAKSRALLHALGNQRPSGETDHPLLAEESRLWSELQRLRSPADQTEDPPNEQARLLLRRKEELDRVRDRLTQLWDELADASPEVKAHRLAEPITVAEVTTLLDGAALVEFFVASRAIHALTISAAGIATRIVATADDPDLDDLYRLLVEEDLGPVLANPVYTRLSQVIDDAARDGSVYVVPHQRLHLLPLHLKAGAPDARARTFLLPSASVLRTKRARPQLAGVALVAGDPSGDLPFARGECAHAAARLGASAPRLGQDVTLDWLAGALREQPVGLVHLACHGVFNERRPELSGLVLADADGLPGLVPLSDLAGLDWAGVVVVLSACNTGMHKVHAGDELAGLGRALLGAGATALITSFRRVPDLATALLMTWFYETLNSLEFTRVGAALAEAQRRLRDATARDLIAWATLDATTGDDRTTLACRVVAAAHRAAGNVDEYVTWQDNTNKCRQGQAPSLANWSRQAAIAAQPQYQAHPFAAPANWASFAILGAG
ncbi:FOG: TPR repeat [Alloactinosynnema sp. L-07]|uniref:CHAT domain-containing tetratricopeptide repeat protein n=1 Tax=Alloactinosynnema sp. L-07 TaxID=1653480 RepID=UPI00065F0991|nr:CHAT domain-containing protein [Alloactinosynnema sp. L-07]CRK56611.1 FOG: TPR repeat [Alloactinosynnema sp. L-07]